MYRKHQREVALVVTDIGLPKMGGQEVFLAVQKINPQVKVILVSGYLDPQAKADLFSAGAKGVIQKPYAPNEILKRVKEAINQM
jgi:DNA-binding NarL/FixJ family response regulator